MVFELLAEDNYGNIPCPFPCHRHIVGALQDIMGRDFPVLPFARIIGACGLAFQPRIFPDYQTVNIRNHEWVFPTAVHIVGMVHLQPRCLHKPLRHIPFQVMPLPDGFPAVFLPQPNPCLVAVDRHRAAVRVQPADCPGIRTPDSGFP